MSHRQHTSVQENWQWKTRNEGPIFFVIVCTEPSNSNSRKVKKYMNHPGKKAFRPFVWILLFAIVWPWRREPAPFPSAHALVSIPSKRYDLSRTWQSRCLSTTSLMARKVTIRIVGRKQGGEAWLEEACDMYLTRLKPSGLEVGTEWYKNDAALIKVHKESLESLSSKYVPMVLLDPRGLRCSSESFTDHVYQWLEEGGSRLIFVIGGGTDDCE
jgi:Predicted SPOUT methyltransferase